MTTKQYKLIHDANGTYTGVIETPSGYDLEVPDKVNAQIISKLLNRLQVFEAANSVKCKWCKKWTPFTIDLTTTPY